MVLVLMLLLVLVVAAVAGYGCCNGKQWLRSCVGARWLGEAPRQPRGPHVLVGPSSGCNLASIGGAQGSVAPARGPVRSSNGGEGGADALRKCEEGGACGGW